MSNPNYPEGVTERDIDSIGGDPEDNPVCEYCKEYSDDCGCKASEDVRKLKAENTALKRQVEEEKLKQKIDEDQMTMAQDTAVRIGEENSALKNQVEHYCSWQCEHLNREKTFTELFGDYQKLLIENAFLEEQKNLYIKNLDDVTAELKSQSEGRLVEQLREENAKLKQMLADEILVASPRGELEEGKEDLKAKLVVAVSALALIYERCGVGIGGSKESVEAEMYGIEEISKEVLAKINEV